MIKYRELITNHVLLYRRFTYVEPDKKILEHFSRRWSSYDGSNIPIILQYMPLVGQTFILIVVKNDRNLT